MVEAGKEPASLDRPRVRVTTALRRLDAEARDRPQSLSAGRTCLGASAIRPSGPSHRPSADVTFASKADSLARTRRHNLRPSTGGYGMNYRGLDLNQLVSLQVLLARSAEQLLRRCSGEAARLGDGDKVSKMPKLHVTTRTIVSI